MADLVPAAKSEEAGLFQKLFELIDSGNQVSVLESLDQHFGGDPNVADEAGTTPLLVASKEGKAEIVRVLMEKRADLMMADLDGDNPLMVAISQGHMQLVEMFLAGDTRGVDVDVPNKIGQTPLMKAANKANIECVNLLLDVKSNPNAKTKFGKTALMQAVEKNSLESAAALLKAGADVAVADDRGFTALFPAAFRCDGPMLELLLSSKANAATKAQPGTALMMAVESPSFKPDAIKLLIAHGCPLDEVAADGETALMKAVEECNVDAVSTLLGARADSLKTNKAGKTALDMSKEKDLTEIEKLLAAATA